MAQYDGIAQAYTRERDALEKRVGNVTRELLLSNIPIVSRSEPRQYRAVDLGCGTGDEVALLQEKGWRAIGVDESEEMIAIARERHPGIAQHFICANYSSVDDWCAIAPDVFHGGTDVVVSRFSFLYLDNPDLVYRTCNELLKVGGELRFVVGHPLMDAQFKKKPYGEQEMIEKQLFHGRVPIHNPSHTFADWFSPYFLSHFQLREIVEDDCAVPNTIVAGIPEFMYIRATKSD